MLEARNRTRRAMRPPAASIVRCHASLREQQRQQLQRRRQGQRPPRRVAQRRRELLPPPGQQRDQHCAGHGRSRDSDERGVPTPELTEPCEQLRHSPRALCRDGTVRQRLWPGGDRAAHAAHAMSLLALVAARAACPQDRVDRDGRDSAVRANRGRRACGGSAPAIAARCRSTRRTPAHPRQRDPHDSTAEMCTAGTIRRLVERTRAHEEHLRAAVLAL